MPNLFDHLTEAKCYDVREVTVRIGRTTYQGAFYKQDRKVSPGCRAYDEGQRDYTIEGLEVIGELPASWVRSSRTVYRMAGDDRDWYVAGYYNRDEPNEWHPFGKMFALQPWSVPGGTRIDLWSPAPYRRMKMEVA